MSIDELVLAGETQLAAPDELATLKQKVLEVDLSLYNPNIVGIIEAEIDKWVESYLRKWEGLLTEKIHETDYYGGVAGIPIAIKLEGKYYTPVQIAEEVHKKTDLGLSILVRLFNYAEKYRDFSWGDKLKQEVADFVPDGADLNKVVVTCCCGQHQQTYRDLLVGFINTDPDSIFLGMGWKDAIKSLYGKDAKYAIVPHGHAGIIERLAHGVYNALYRRRGR